MKKDQAAMKLDTAVVGGKIVLPGRAVVEGSIGIRDGRVAAIVGSDEALDAHRVIDARGDHILPGIVESHTHFCTGNGYEDLTTESTAALLSGVTSVLFFLRHPAPYDETYRSAVAEGERRSPIDFGFHVVLLTDEHLAAIPRYLHEYGITSFKFYMTYRGKDAAMMHFDGEVKRFSGVTDGFMLACMEALSREPAALMMVHAENIEIIDRLRTQYSAEGRQDMNAWQASRPTIAELEAVERCCLFASQTGARVLFLHLTTDKALEAIERARAAHAKLHVEVCHPYLGIHDDGNLGREAKMKPPFRPLEDVQGLWNGVAAGQVDTIASDHVPRPLAGKLKDLWTDASGTAGTPTMLPFIIEEGYHRRGIPLPKLVELVTLNPAKLFGLYPRKGDIRIGADADLVITDLSSARVVRASELGSCADYSLYEGRSLRGWAKHVLVRGRVVLDDGVPLEQTGGWGRYLARPT